MPGLLEVSCLTSIEDLPSISETASISGRSHSKLTPKHTRLPATQQYLRYEIISGGHFAPAIATALAGKKKRCPSPGGSHNGPPPPPPFTIKVDSVGIINGLIDPLNQIGSFPNFAVNNTYGIKAYDDSVAAQIAEEFAQPGGCKDQAQYCLQLQAASDPDNHGNNETVNGVCLVAFAGCWENVYGPYEAFSGVSAYQ